MEYIVYQMYNFCLFLNCVRERKETKRLFVQKKKPEFVSFQLLRVVSFCCQPKGSVSWCIIFMSNKFVKF